MSGTEAAQKKLEFFMFALVFVAYPVALAVSVIVNVIVSSL